MEQRSRGGPATLANGELVTDFNPYQPRTFALKLGGAPVTLQAPQSQPVALAYERRTATRDGRPADGSFDNAGRALPAEMMPTQLSYAGVQLHLAPASEPNAIVAHGQTIQLPAGEASRLYLLAASAQGDRKATFRIGGQSVDLTIHDWGGFVGQWDNRTWKNVQIPVPPEPSPDDQSDTARRARRVRRYIKEHGPMMPEFAGLTPGFIKGAPVAWFASHRHAADGSNEPYSFSYLFAYSVDVPANARTLVLPDDGNIRIFAMTVTDENQHAKPAQPLGDTL